MLSSNVHKELTFLLSHIQFWVDFYNWPLGTYKDDCMFKLLHIHNWFHTKANNSNFHNMLFVWHPHIYWRKYPISNMAVHNLILSVVSRLRKGHPYLIIIVMTFFIKRQRRYIHNNFKDDGRWVERITLICIRCLVDCSKKSCKLK